MDNSAYSTKGWAGAWLPDMDLNHDKQIQSLLCYRYTIGHAGAANNLEGLPRQSSRALSLSLSRESALF